MIKLTIVEHVLSSVIEKYKSLILIFVLILTMISWMHNAKTCFLVDTDIVSASIRCLYDVDDDV